MDRRVRDIDTIRLNQRFTDFVALGELESISHRAADQNGVGFVKQPVDDFDLIRHFCSAQNDYERMLRFLQFLSEEFQLPLHQQPGSALAAAFCNDSGHAFGRGVSAMSRPERIVHINVRNFRELLSEGRLVRLLFVVVTNVFQKKHVPWLEQSDGLLHLLTNAIIDECHRPAEHVGQFVGDWPQ